jgi:hypothetical protein
MKVCLAIILFLLTLEGINTSVAIPNEFSGYMTVEGRLFFNDPRFPGQSRNNVSFAIQPEYYHEWENGSSFIFVPFARLDSADSRRSHFDVREMNYLWLGDPWELRVGIGKVFWGVTEFVHLVDIINQTDLVEDPDGEEKLGQPMVNLTLPKDWGTIEMFLLPYFRERTFPGTDGRLRSALVVNTDKAAYESGAEEGHLDIALRYSHSIGNWDFGIYNFNGTGREPTMRLALDENGLPVLIPTYEQINQTGVDVQTVAGEWLWKLEALYRSGQGKDFFASTGGFEYTFVGIADTSMDLDVIGELAYDDRGAEATTPFENDAMFALRLAVNDASSSEVLMGFIQDLDSSSRSFSIEGSRRFGDRWLLSIESRVFLDQSESDVLYSMRDDDYFQLKLAYYF